MHTPTRIRWGWRVLAFIVVVAVALIVLDGPLTALVARWTNMTTTGIAPGDLRAPLVSLRWVDVALVLLVMRAFALLEHASLGQYGLPWHMHAVSKVAVGLLAGIVAVSLVIGCLLMAGSLQFGAPLSSPASALHEGAQWMVALLAVGCLEELLFRGYLLTTLTRGLGYWPAAVLLSALFTAAHARNPGETVAGLSAVFLFGMLFCGIVNRTGSLWLAIGIHAGWDWAQSFLYGVADSGTIARGRLFAPLVSGASWLSGGTAGPEGSLITLGLLVVALTLTRWRAAGSA